MDEDIDNNDENVWQYDFFRLTRADISTDFDEYGVIEYDLETYAKTLSVAYVNRCVLYAVRLSLNLQSCVSAEDTLYLLGKELIELQFTDAGVHVIYREDRVLPLGVVRRNINLSDTFREETVTRWIYFYNFLHACRLNMFKWLTEYCNYLFITNQMSALVDLMMTETLDMVFILSRSAIRFWEHVYSHYSLEAPVCDYFVKIHSSIIMILASLFPAGHNHEFVSAVATGAIRFNTDGNCWTPRCVESYEAVYRKLRRASLFANKQPRGAIRNTAASNRRPIRI